MTPKKEPQSLEDFLQPLEKSFQEAKSRFTAGTSGIVSPRTGEAPRSDDKVLISLSEQTTQIIQVINPKIIPYQVMYSTEIIPDFVKEILCPTTKLVQQENPWSQIVYVYGKSTRHINSDIEGAFKSEITKQMVDITRKSFIFMMWYKNADRRINPNGSQAIRISNRDEEIIKSAHGYENR